MTTAPPCSLRCRGSASDTCSRNRCGAAAKSPSPFLPKPRGGCPRAVSNVSGRANPQAASFSRKAEQTAFVRGKSDAKSHRDADCLRDRRRVRCGCSPQPTGALMSTKLLVSLCAVAALLAACSKRDETATTPATTTTPAETPPPPAETPPPADTQPPPSETPPAETQPSNPPPSGG